MLCERARWIALVSIQLATVLVVCGAMEAVAEESEMMCAETADIVFVVESSNGMSDENFQQELKFVTNLTKTFMLDNIKVGLVVYGCKVKKIFDLNENRDQRSLTKAISATRQVTQGSRTHRALDFVRQEMFLPSVGGRANVTQIVIVLTSCTPTSPALVARASAALKDFGAVIIAVGIGYKDEAKAWCHLQDLASVPSLAFQSRDVSTLPIIQYEVTRQTCGGVDLNCSGILDIIFAVDISGSIGREQFAHQLQVAIRMLYFFEVSIMHTRIGFILFGETLTRVFTLTNAPDYMSMVEHIGRITYTGEKKTYIGNALTKATSMFSLSMGGRANSSDVIILLSDGHASDATKALEAANVAKKKGIRIVAASASRHHNSSNLMEIASRDDFIPPRVYDFQYGADLSKLVSRVPDVTPFPNRICEQPLCARPADIVLILDGAQHYGSANQHTSVDWENIKKFAADLIQHFDIGQRKVQLGVFRSGGHGAFIRHLHDTSNKTEISRLIRGIPIWSGKDYGIDIALQLARNRMFSKNNGGRSDAVKMIILVTRHGVHQEHILQEFKQHLTQNITNIVITKDYTPNSHTLATTPFDFFNAYDFDVLSHRFPGPIARWACYRIDNIPQVEESTQ